VQAASGKVIHVDFATRQREGGRVVRPREAAPPATPPAAGRPLGSASEFVLLWRPPATRATAEYLGGRWDWGWTLFVWTSETAVGAQWTRIVAGRGYVPQHLSREAFIGFLHRASEIGGLLLDGELEGTGEVIRAEPEQLIGREAAIAALDG
jgi:hypothetical protein